MQRSVSKTADQLLRAHYSTGRAQQRGGLRRDCAALEGPLPWMPSRF